MMEGRGEALKNGKMGKVDIGGWTAAHAAQVMKVWERQVSLLGSYGNLSST